MVIFVNLEHLHHAIKEKILREIETEFFPNDNNITNYYRIIYQDNSTGVYEMANSEIEYNTIKGIELDEEAYRLKDINLRLKEILVRLAVPDYVVIKDSNSPDNLTFLERSKVESKGVLHCRHCGMEFEDEIQLGNHLRIHFII